MTATQKPGLSYITYSRAMELGGRYAELARKAAHQGRPLRVPGTKNGERTGTTVVFTISDARIINMNTETTHAATCHLARSTARSARMGFHATVAEAAAYGFKACSKCL